jgi:carboxypeptidase PM20D1
VKIARRVLLGVLFVLAVVLIVRTLGFRSVPVKVRPASAAEISDDVLNRLSGAVRIRTVSYEPDRADKIDRAAFAAFLDYLEKSFPLVHAGLEREVIGSFALHYRWPGRRPELKPILLLAHMDVVPAAEDGPVRWTHPPFDGIIADGFVWGRGTLDDKQSLLGILEAVEGLLREGFVPDRGVDLAFGCDEEVGGAEGAARIAAKLRADGRSFELVLDEGLMIMQEGLSGLTRPVALIGTAEKGYASLELRVKAAGGHSSLPPKRTAIGALGRAVSRLEEHPFPARLRQPTRDMLLAIGPEMPFLKRLLMANLWLFGRPLMIALSGSPASDAVIRTTTAATIFQSGIKENVLPAEARAVVNFRILPGETVADVVEHVRSVVADAQVEITVRPNPVEPSRVSSADSEAFRRLQATILQVFPDALVAPGLMVGATDSRRYETLSENIFRFNPVRLTTADLARPHGVDERIAAAGYKDQIRFFMQLIRNVSG